MIVYATCFLFDALMRPENPITALSPNLTPLLPPRVFLGLLSQPTAAFHYISVAEISPHTSETERISSIDGSRFSVLPMM